MKNRNPGPREAPSSNDTPPRPDPWLADWRLPGGGTVRFRHVQPSDESLIADAIRTASRETLLHRFFSPIRAVPSERLRQMLTIDRSREVCIVGVLHHPSAYRLICGARYVRFDRRPEAAEIALTVHDDFQRHGLGTFLLALLTRMARNDGIRSFEADVMSSNRGMLRLLEKTFPGKLPPHRAGDVCHFVIALD